MSPEEKKELLERALEYHKANEFDKAEAIYKQVREACPREFDPWFLSGAMAFQRGGHLDFSIQLLEQAKRINPFSDPCRLFLGMAYADRGRFADAEPLLRRALKTLPQYPEAWENLGRCQLYLTMFDDAVHSFKKAIELKPYEARYHLHLGEALFRSKGVTAAEEHFRISTELDPDIPEAWNNLGLCLIEQPGKIAEGLQAIQKALDISHDNPNFKAAKFLALTRLYRLEEAYEYIQEVTSGFFWRQQEMSSLCCILNYLPEKSREEIFNSHVRYGKSLFSFGMSTWENEPNPDKKLHIGFVSAYFRRHSVAYFLLPLLQLLDKRQFSVYLYFCGEREDSTSDEFKLCSSKWVNISQTPDEEAAQQIKKDSIDILFDLTGHFANNRLSLFGELPAPIQATFLGYPNTTGLSSIKYRFVDEITDPPGSEKFATEQLVRFSPCAWCYDPLVDAPEPQMPQLNTPLTFGSFNNFLKVNRKVLNVWKQILENFPESRLLLKSINFSDPTVREEVTKKIKNSGIELSRVELREFVDNLPDHLRMYSEVDVALDTFPYNGTTTTCEALWMGVPVVTLVGDRHSSRVGLSLLSAVGHPEWAAQNEDEYIQKAVELAKNRNLRIHLRSNLRKEIAESRLCNKQAYASDFCNAVRKLWVQWCTEQTT